MRRLFLVPSILLVIGLAGCQSMEVTSQYGPGMSVGGIDSNYDWRPSDKFADSSLARAGDPWANNPRLTKLIEDLMDDALQAKGFQRNEQEPDVFIIHRTRRWNRPSEYTGTDWGEQLTGQLTIQILDAEDGSLMWQSRVETKVDEADSPAQREQRIRSAVNRVIKEMPSPS